MRTTPIAGALLAGCVALLLRAQAPGPAAVGPGTWKISQVRGDLYKVETGPAVSPVTVFLVTAEGIVLADPLNPEFATWLKSELAQRFPGKPVKYVITHYHWDHARGGKVFADTAQFLAHETMAKNLDAPLSQAPPPGDLMDTNGDNRISRDEAKTGTRANFDRFDTNKDGFLTQAEFTVDIARPTITFKNRYRISLGGKRVEVIWARNRHSTDTFDLYFPAERALFAGDYIWINRMCCNFEFDHRPIQTWIDSIRRLERLDFDLLINSHWDAGTKTDLVHFREWLEDLRDAVAAGIRQSTPLAELRTSIKLTKYKTWAGYDQQLPQIIDSAYASLKQSRRP